VSAKENVVHTAPRKQNYKFRHVLATKMVDDWPLLGHARRTSENTTKNN